MKILPAHYAHMKTEIAKISLDRVNAHFEAIKCDPRVKDVNRRLRYDCMYAAKLSTWVCDNIYQYAHDSHIDTALRKIALELNFPKV